MRPGKPWNVYQSEREDGSPCWYADENFYEWTGEWQGSVSNEFDTFAEAITYAQEHAKTEALKEPS